MSKITLNNVNNLTSWTSAGNTIDANSLAIENAVENTLSRDGTSPNEMNADLDMNSNQILNLPFPATASSPIRLQDAPTFASPPGPPGAPGVPGSGSQLVYNILADFVAATGIPTPITTVKVLAVTGSYPATGDLTATPLTYKKVNSSTLYGNLNVDGKVWEPMYSTNPVNCGEFGAIGDCVSQQIEISANFMATTSAGSSTITLFGAGVTCAGLGIQSGWRIANVNWSTLGPSRALPANSIIDQILTTTTFSIKAFGGGSAVAPTTENSAGWHYSQSTGITPSTGLQFVAWPDAISGTDNTIPIQQALDFAQQRGLTDVVLPTGQYMTTDTIMVGWADSFFQLCFRAAQKRQGYVGTRQGTCIYPTQVDRPAIAFGGYRTSGMYGIAIRGRNYNYCQGGMEGILNLSPNVKDWLAPHLTPSGTNPGGISINAPYCGIGINPYNGVRQANHYPDRLWPTWTPVGQVYTNNAGLYQYTNPSPTGGAPQGGAPGSDLTIEDCEVAGFGVNIMGNPNGDGNGDFTRIRSCFLKQAPYNIAICNTQARNLEVRNIAAQGNHTFLTNRAFNSLPGELGGPIDNCSTSTSYQLFDIVTNYSLPVEINNIYTENSVRIGDFFGSTGVPVSFNGGHLDLQNPVHGQIVNSLMYNEVPVFFNGLTITSESRLTNLSRGGGAVRITGGNLFGGTLNATSTSRIRAINYCGGVLAGSSRFNSSGTISARVSGLVGTYYAGPISIASSGSTYDNATGVVTLQLTQTLGDSLAVNDKFIVQNISGSANAMTFVNGIQTATAATFANGSFITFNIGGSHTPVTITGGQISLYPVPIVSGSYTSSTGEVVVTLGRANVSKITGQSNLAIGGVTATGSGAGNVARLNGTAYLFYTSPAGHWVGDSLHYYIAPGLGDMTVTGGFINGFGTDSFVYDNTFNVRTGQRWGMTQYADTYIDDLQRVWRISVPQHQTIDTASFFGAHPAVEPTYNKDIITFDYASSQESTTVNVITPGDILYHITSGTIYIVLTVSTPSGGWRTITAEQQNNLLLATDGEWIANTGAGGTNDNTSWHTTGYVVHITTGAIIPTQLYFGTFGSGSVNVTAVAHDGDNTGTAIGGYYAVGDPIYGQNSIPATPFKNGNSWASPITGGTPGIMTLTSAATAAATNFPIFPYELK